MGTSYYPFWTKNTAAQMREWADYITTKFDKDILIMETGYSWDKTLPDGTQGQLSDNSRIWIFPRLDRKTSYLSKSKK
ncbi:arabinogalactan endo-1,4-beta-galactosidase [Bacteroides ovatus]|nr:arabinogalactan endo-1,4-beta-galactosidase [Bacteroides ovatus]